MTDNVKIRETDSRYLEFFAPERHLKLEQLDYFSVRFKSVTIDCTARVYAYQDGKKLAMVFSEMAMEWRGWDGKKEWQSLEQEFDIACEITKLGVVTINFSLTPSLDREWDVSSSISFGSGELEVISKRISSFFMHE
ncbi:MAG: hypothetical protein KTR32_39285 [Granulosicoccus sp.]|nr:hypothetical protein [Granulosicoccus sp.]